MNGAGGILAARGRSHALGLHPDVGMRAHKVPFIYTVPFGIGGLGTTLAASAVAQRGSVATDLHAAFCALQIAFAYLTTTDAAIATDPRFLFRLVRGSRGNQGYAHSNGVLGVLPLDSPTHILNIAGTGKKPAYLPSPIVFQPGELVTVELTNLEAVARHVEIAFIGYQLLRAAGAVDDEIQAIIATLGYAGGSGAF
jgi:hypothetical protein